MKKMLSKSTRQALLLGFALAYCIGAGCATREAGRSRTLYIYSNVDGTKITVNGGRLQKLAADQRGEFAIDTYQDRGPIHVKAVSPLHPYALEKIVKWKIRADGAFSLVEDAGWTVAAIPAGPYAVGKDLFLRTYLQPENEIRFEFPELPPAPAPTFTPAPPIPPPQQPPVVAAPVYPCPNPPCEPPSVPPHSGLLGSGNWNSVTISNPAPRK